MPTFSIQQSRCRVRPLVCTAVVALAAVALCAGLPQASLANGQPRRAPGLFLSGPLTDVSLETSYTYDLEVVTRKSYRNAAVVFVVPPAQCSFTKVVKLVAGQPWKESYTVAFETTSGMSPGGIAVTVWSSPYPNKGGRPVLSKAYAVTPTPNQAPPVPGSSGVSCAKSFVGS
jgi:hypothetical protein